MAHRFLGSFVTEPWLTASVHRVGDVTIEIALVPATIRTIQVFVHRQDPGEVAILRLADQEQVKDALPEPEQEGALKGPVGETVPCNPGIGGLGPLPDASPDEVEVVEGVRSEAEDKAWKLAFDLGAMISDARGILDNLQIASSKAIDDCGITSGRLDVQDEGLAVSVAWNSDGATLTVQGGVLADEED